MADVYAQFSTRKTPQKERADSRQVPNRSGGFVFETGDVEQLRRFLTIGSTGDYYSSGKDLTAEGAGLVMKMAKVAPDVLLKTIIDVSTRGAAPKQQPAIFALAIAASRGDAEARGNALAALPAVCRTASTLYQFAEYVQNFRGWGRGLRRGVAGWLTSKDADALAFQMVKYRQRNGYTGRDLLRLSHPSTNDPGLRAVFDWMAHGAVGDATPRIIEGFLLAQAGPSEQASEAKTRRAAGHHYATIVREYGLSWEMLPDAALSEPEVWDALLDVGIPQTALMRQLPRLTNLGMLPQIGGRTTEVAAQLQDPARLKRGRVHPMNALIAMRTYQQGRSLQGKSSWTPTTKIVDALDAAFYNAYGAVEPAGKRTLVALDVSGSMTAPVAGLPLSCREASAALALVIMATEPDVAVIGYTSSGAWGRSDGVTPLNISPRQRLTDAVKVVSGLRFGGTDCALPFEWAKANKHEFDTVVSLTDNETYAGPVHVHQALGDYRRATGLPVRAVAAAFASTHYSVLDPKDPGSLNVVGMDSSVPTLINAFSRGL